MRSYTNNEEGAKKGYTSANTLCLYPCQLLSSIPDERSRSRSPLPQSTTPTTTTKKVTTTTTASDVDPSTYTKPFLDFISTNPTVFHCIDHFTQRLDKNGFTALSERDDWSGGGDNNKCLKAGGKYYTTRNGSSMIAFVVGKGYKPGNGFSMVAGHVDALTVKCMD